MREQFRKVNWNFQLTFLNLSNIHTYTLFTYTHANMYFYCLIATTSSRGNKTIKIHVCVCIRVLSLPTKHCLACLSNGNLNTARQKGIKIVRKYLVQRKSLQIFRYEMNLLSL